MELDYLSQKEPNLTFRYSQYDKFYKSLQMSVKQIPTAPLAKKTKAKIYKIIQKDQPTNLSTFLQRQAISFDTEIGPVASQWNIIHICLKLNSIECLQYILKAQFQQYQQGYYDLVNSVTIEGYTPTMIAIISKSYLALQLLLNCGGVDIYTVDKHKMTASDIAINYRNENAIQILMNYQKKCKKKPYINTQKLSEPIVLKPNDSFCDRMVLCLISCLSFGFFQQEQDQIGNKASLTARISHIMTTQEEVIIDYVKIDNGSELKDYEIQWKRAIQIINSHQITLYDNYNPFQICQKNFTLPNHLIIFQVVCQHPYLIRKLINVDKNNPNHYNVQLYPNRACQKINVDDYVPFIKQRNQPMFFSDNSQLWPMLVQKGLAKWHQSYLNLGKMSPKMLFQELTGAYTTSIPVSQIKDITHFLQNLSSKGYLHVLVSKKNCSLSSQHDQEDCFSVLNFYQKGQKKMILINSSYIIEQWKQKQKFQLLQMKIIKSHYNNHNQMCIWIDSDKIQQYFSQLIICYTIPNFQRSQIKFKAKKYVFFKFRIEKLNQEIYLTLHDGNTLQNFNLSQMVGWKNQGVDVLTISQSEISGQNIVYINQNTGQYMCKFQMNDCIQRNLVMVCWSTTYTQLQFVEEQFAIIEWLGSFKKYLKKNWKPQTTTVFQQIGEVNLLLIKNQYSQRVLLRNNLDKQSVIDGHFISKNEVQLIRQKNYYYCVFRAIIPKQSLIIDFIS